MELGVSLVGWWGSWFVWQKLYQRYKNIIVKSGKSALF